MTLSIGFDLTLEVSRCLVVSVLSCCRLFLFVRCVNDDLLPLHEEGSNMRFYSLTTEVHETLEEAVKRDNIITLYDISE